MRNRIDWSDLRLGSGVYENMVSVLISRLHPEAQRIDGSGGDGGRDVQLPLPSGLEIFELKSFTGRLSRERNRRRQVEKSLKRAANHNPVAWYLVVPINHTDAELKWFNELAADYPFPCKWLGEDWLNDNMASHPDIPRFYLEGTAEEIVTILREMSQEQAALGRGVLDAIDRIKNLMIRLNQLDPHYAFGFSSQPDGSITISMVPRYKGAEQDRPVKVGGSFQFPDTEAGRRAAQSFQDAVNYGTAGTVSGEFVKQLAIDAPAGMGGTFEGGDLLFKLTDNAVAADVQMALCILDQNGNIVTQVALLGQTRTAGQRGGEVTLVDIGGALNVTMRFDAPTHRMNLHYQYKVPAKVLPSSLLPALSFLTALHPGRQLVVLIEGRDAGPPIAVTRQVDERLVGFRALVQDLADIQHMSSVYFPMPMSLSDEDLEQIADVHRLLSGETQTGTWSELTLTMTVEAFNAGLAQEFTAGEVKHLFTESELILVLDRQELPVGRVRKILATARLAAQPKMAPDVPPDTLVDVAFVPGSDDSVTISLVASEPTP
jgi:hypothetical protein